MSETGDPAAGKQARAIEPVRATRGAQEGQIWTARLIWFLRVMAVLAMMKGLYHWSVVIGLGDGRENAFALHSLPWQTATVFFAVFDLVAAVGLWLAAVWGAVVWLTAAVSMAAVEVFFPQVYGGRGWVVMIEIALLVCYLVLAILSAREHPN